MIICAGRLVVVEGPASPDRCGVTPQHHGVHELTKGFKVAGGGRSLTATISAHHALSDLRPAPELDGSKLRVD
ncbi:hypothetical protein PR003_g23788 [Phytophthora rubi]|uniref:Uncharacterized protein n=1 Tax=Phytophthora rubi TaxID=129364 RepID=A0A6A3K1F0_9STRA|nr:hypothetical protein PR002_g17924 [Phytophthora rubi]KAE9296323.1 hypothetical protein PR003_g23788 [Phytophthora rubi]